MLSESLNHIFLFIADNNLLIFGLHFLVHFLDRKDVS